jgi:hypothetical protein
MDRLDPHAVAARLGRIRRRRAALAVVFLGLPVPVLAYLYGPWSHYARSVLLPGWVAIYSIVMLTVAWSRCPRCRALFFVGKPLFRVDPLRRRCAACGCRLSGVG